MAGDGSLSYFFSNGFKPKNYPLSHGDNKLNKLFSIK